MSKFNVYVIHSAKPLPELKVLLDECGGYTYAGIIYKSFHRRGRDTEKEETKKTIVFCSEETIRKLEQSYPHIFKTRIADYNWESFPLPNEEIHETWDLHISGVPNDYTVKDAEQFVIDTLKCILPQKDEEKCNFIVEFAPRLRATGVIFGFGHINFASHVDKEIIKLCKLVLHNTPLAFKINSKETRMVTCVWHRKPQEKPETRKQTKAVSKRGESQKINFKQSENVKRARPAAVHQVDVSTLSVPSSKTSGWSRQNSRKENRVSDETGGSLNTVTKDGVVPSTQH